MLAGFHQPVAPELLALRKMAKGERPAACLYPKSAKPFSRNAAIIEAFCAT